MEPPNDNNSTHVGTEREEKALVRNFFIYWNNVDWQAPQENLPGKESSQQIDEYVRNAPEKAWPIILALVQEAPSDSLLALVAAGPLENLLCRHGCEFIERIEAEALAHEKFRKCLRAVWGRPMVILRNKRKVGMTQDVYDRVQLACASEPRW